MLASSPASRSAVASPAAEPLAWKTTSQSSGARSGDAKRAPSACASPARPEAISITVTSAPGNRAHRYATRRPTSPPPTTAMRSAGPGAPSQTPLRAVSMLGASTARHGGIAVLHGERERPAHEGRPHAIVLVRRHASGPDKTFGAAADGAEESTHAHLAGLGRGDLLLAQLGAAGADIPEGLALHLRHIPGWAGE